MLASALTACFRQLDSTASLNHNGGREGGLTPLIIRQSK